MNNKLFYYRKIRGMKQIDLAKRVGLSELAISTFETGRAKPSQKVALRIAKALSLKVRQIFPDII